MRIPVKALRVFHLSEESRGSLHRISCEVRTQNPSSAQVNDFAGSLHRISWEYRCNVPAPCTSLHTKHTRNELQAAPVTGDSEALAPLERKTRGAARSETPPGGNRRTSRLSTDAHADIGFQVPKDSAKPQRASCVSDF